MKRIIIIALIAVLSQLQNVEQNKENSENFIDPSIVMSGNSIPAQQVNVEKANNQGVLPQKNNVQDAQGQNIPISGQVVNSQNKGEHAAISQEAMQKAKQNAQRAKQMAEQARKQAEQDRKSRQQKQEDELKSIQSDGTLSKTERKKQQERLLFRKVARTVEPGTRFTEYLFQQTSGSSQFFIKLPAAQQVALNFYTYVSQDNTYVRTKNIEEEEPVKIFIYENNNKIVYQGQFYYQNYIVFEGQAGAMYLIRVFNGGSPKLISMNTKKLVEDRHIQKTLKKSDGGHVERTQNLAVELNRWYQQFRKIRMLDYQDLKAVQGYISKYYSWQIIETIIAVILCGFQVNLIQKMLKGNSIV